MMKAAIVSYCLNHQAVSLDLLGDSHCDSRNSPTYNTVSFYPPPPTQTVRTRVSIIRVLVRGGVHSTFIFLSTFFRNAFVSSVWSWSLGGNFSPVAFSSLWNG